MGKDDNVETTPVAPEIDEAAVATVAREAAEAAVSEEGFLKSLFAKAFGGNESETDEDTDVDNQTVVVIPEGLQKQIDDMTARQEQLETDLAKANDRVALAESTTEEREFLAKAQEFKSVTGDIAELAKFMAFVSKSDGDQFEYFENFVKGIDAQLAEVGIYSEFGKIASPDQDDDVIQNVIKSGEAKDEREAFMNMDEKDANSYLADRRKEIRG